MKPASLWTSTRVVWCVFRPEADDHVLRIQHSIINSRNGQMAFFSHAQSDVFAGELNIQLALKRYGLSGASI